MNPVLRKQCTECGKYLLAIEGAKNPFYVHPASPCSGTTDAIEIVVEVLDENLQKIWETLYPNPKYSDHQLLNKIWEHPLLRWLCKKLIK